MASLDELKICGSERVWWERVRARGAMWYLVNKGLLFLVLYPPLGCYALDWEWEPALMVEGWTIGLVCGGFVWMRKELRYRFTLECDGGIAPRVGDE